MPNAATNGYRRVKYSLRQRAFSLPWQHTDDFQAKVFVRVG
jgi:hypothetical protein